MKHDAATNLNCPECGEPMKFRGMYAAFVCVVDKVCVLREDSGSDDPPLYHWPIAQMTSPVRVGGQPSGEPR